MTQTPENPRNRDRCICIEVIQINSQQDGNVSWDCCVFEHLCYISLLSNYCWMCREITTMMFIVFVIVDSLKQYLNVFQNFEWLKVASVGISAQMKYFANSSITTTTEIQTKTEIEREILQTNQIICKKNYKALIYSVTQHVSNLLLTSADRTHLSCQNAKKTN